MGFHGTRLNTLAAWDLQMVRHQKKFGNHCMISFVWIVKIVRSAVFFSCVLLLAYLVYHSPVSKCGFRVCFLLIFKQYWWKRKCRPQQKKGEKIWKWTLWHMHAVYIFPHFVNLAKRSYYGWVNTVTCHRNANNSVWLLIFQSGSFRWKKSVNPRATPLHYDTAKSNIIHMNITPSLPHTHTYVQP